MKKTKRRPRQDEATWRGLLSRHAGSGLSAVAFDFFACTRCTINVGRRATSPATDARRRKYTAADSNSRHSSHERTALLDGHARARPSRPDPAQSPQALCDGPPQTRPPTAVQSPGYQAGLSAWFNPDCLSLMDSARITAGRGSLRSLRA